MRRHHSLDHTDSVQVISKKTPVQKSHPKITNYKKRRWGKFVVWALVAVIVAILGYIGVSAYNAANKVFTQDGGIRSILNQNALKQTDGITNILLLGKGGANHNGGQLTDSILLIRIRQSDKKIATISIPRDLYVTIPGHGQGKINEAYANGYNSTKDVNQKNQAGVDLASEVIGDISGVPIHYTATVDFVGLQKIVDVLGGVEVTVEKDLIDPLYPKDVVTSDGQFRETEAYTTVNIKAGRQTMDGDTALKYARSRESTSDFDRSKRQQILIVAIKDKAVSLGVLANPVKVTELLSSVSDHVKIDMSLSEIKGLIELVKNMKKDEIISQVLDNDPQKGLLYEGDGAAYYLLPKGGNFKEVQAMIKNVFEDEVSELISVEVLNGTGQVGLASEFAQKLKNQDIKVTNIGNYKQEVDMSQIQNGTGSSSVFAKIKSYFDSVEVSDLDEKGKIVVIIGKDYGE